MANQITPNPSVPTQIVADGLKFPKFINNLGIIPTSYKDSMSYYECLAWLCKYLEETVIPTVNQNGKAVEELQALYIELNQYVTNYFNNLDVQEEINNKLDEMVESGTFQNVLSYYFNDLETLYDNRFNSLNEDMTSFQNRMNAQILEVKDDLGNIVSGAPAGVYATVSALTTADPDHSKIYVVLDDGKWYYYSSGWVAGGTYQSTSLTLDKTLLSEDTASESKAVGDNLRNIASCFGNKFNVLNFENGTIGNTGEIETAIYRIVSSRTIYFPFDITISIPSGFQLGVHGYSSSDVWDSTAWSGWKTGSWKINKNTYVKFIIKQLVEDTTSTLDVTSTINQFSFKSEIDITNENNLIEFKSYFKNNIIDDVFANGGINDSGGITNLPYRISITKILSFNNDITIIIPNLFRIGVHYYNSSGTLTQDAGWQYGYYTIPAGSYFRFVIARYVEVPSETLSMATTLPLFKLLRNQEIVFNNTTSLNEELLTHKFDMNNYMTGNLGDTGAFVQQLFRVVSKRLTTYPVDVTITIPSAHRLGVHYFNSSGVWQSWAGWKTGQYIIPKNTYFKLLFTETPDHSGLILPSEIVPLYSIEETNYSSTTINENITFESTSRQGEVNGYPENTLEGFAEAKKCGYNHIRVSFGWTSDNVAVCLHELYAYQSTLRNSDGTSITDQSLRFDQMTYDQIENYDAGIYKGSQFAGIKVPTLEGVLKQAKKLNQKVDIEFKFGYSQARCLSLLQLIYTLGMQDYCLYSTGYVPSLQYIQSSNYPIKTAYIGYFTQENIQTCITNNFDRLDMFDTDTYDSSLALLCHQNNILIKVGSAYDMADVKDFVEKYDVIECANISNPIFYIDDLLDD